MTRRFLSALLVTLIPVLVASVGVVLVQGYLSDRLMQDARTRLAGELRGFAALYDQRRVIAVRQAMEFRNLDPQDTGAVYVLLDRAGRALGGNVAAWPAGLPRPDEGAVRFDQIDLKDRDYLVATRGLRGGFSLLTGVDLSPLQATLATFRNVVIGFGAVMVLAGLGAAWVTARRANARLAQMNQALDRIGATSGLDQRLPQDGGPDEFATLRRHINAMLDRISHLFAAHARLGDTVAHEMRTPLARIQSQLEALDVSDAARAGLDDEIRSTIRLFDSLLSIAAMDAEAGSSAGLDPLDLSATCVGIIELYQPVAEEEDRHLRATISEGATILGDGQLIAQMMSNLIENGLKYTRPGDEIFLELDQQGDRVRLSIGDTGPGLDRDLAKTVFKPFARGADVGDKPGHGLGLSLVRAIALRHGAVVRLPDIDQGFALEITFRRYVSKDGAA